MPPPRPRGRMGAPRQLLSVNPGPGEKPPGNSQDRGENPIAWWPEAPRAEPSPTSGLHPVAAARVGLRDGGDWSKARRRRTPPCSGGHPPAPHPYPPRVNGRAPAHTPDAPVGGGEPRHRVGDSRCTSRAAYNHNSPPQRLPRDNRPRKNPPPGSLMGRGKKQWAGPEGTHPRAYGVRRRQGPVIPRRTGRCTGQRGGEKRKSECWGSKTRRCRGAGALGVIPSP